MRRSRGREAVAVGQVPVVRARERLGVRVAWLPAEEPLRLRGLDVRVPMRGLVMPLGERREAGELERAQGDLGGACGDGPEAAGRAGVVDERLKVRADGAE